MTGTMSITAPMSLLQFFRTLATMGAKMTGSVYNAKAIVTLMNTAERACTVSGGMGSYQFQVATPADKVTRAIGITAPMSLPQFCRTVATMGVELTGSVYNARAIVGLMNIARLACIVSTGVTTHRFQVATLADQTTEKASTSAPACLPRFYRKRTVRRRTSAASAKGIATMTISALKACSAFKEIPKVWRSRVALPAALVTLHGTIIAHLKMNTRKYVLRAIAAATTVRRWERFQMAGLQLRKTARGHATRTMIAILSVTVWNTRIVSCVRRAASHPLGIVLNTPLGNMRG